MLLSRQWSRNASRWGARTVAAIFQSPQQNIKLYGDALASFAVSRTSLEIGAESNSISKPQSDCSAILKIAPNNPSELSLAAVINPFALNEHIAPVAASGLLSVRRRCLSVSLRRACSIARYEEMNFPILPITNRMSPGSHPLRRTSRSPVGSAPMAVP